MKLLVAVLSEQCNLNCSYCNVDKWSKKRIDPHLYIQEYYKLRNQFPNEWIQVDFYGGEPLLQFDLIQTIVEELKNEDNLTFAMPTNGLLIDEGTANYLIDNNIQVSISFDGLWHEKNRIQLNGKTTTHRLLEKKELFKRLPKVTCHTMISRGCYNLLENHLFIQRNFGFNPELTLVRDVGTWDKASVEKLKVGITELFDYYIQNPSEEIPNFIKFYLKHFIMKTKEGYTKDNCGAGTDILMFSENNIVPCNRFKDDPEMIADIPKYAKMKECETCEVRDYCEKGCLFEQIKNKGPIEELCDIYRYVYREVKRMIRDLKENTEFREMIKKEINQ
jgi:uncharacterized protein